MTRKYSLVIEGDSTGYSAYVPELPTSSRNRPLPRRTNHPRDCYRRSSNIFSKGPVIRWPVKLEHTQVHHLHLLQGL